MLCQQRLCILVKFVSLKVQTSKGTNCTLQLQHYLWGRLKVFAHFSTPPNRTTPLQTCPQTLLRSCSMDAEWCLQFLQFDALRATAGPKKGQAWDQTRISSQVTDEAFVHPKPPGCPDSIYDTIIVRCLEYEPDARPRFTAIRAKLAFAAGLWSDGCGTQDSRRG